MNTEQERAAFEAWLGIKPCGSAHDFGWEAWRARAALQSQDQEDAERFKAVGCGCYDEDGELQLDGDDGWERWIEKYPEKYFPVYLDTAQAASAAEGQSITMKHLSDKAKREALDAIHDSMAVRIADQGASAVEGEQ